MLYRFPAKENSVDALDSFFPYVLSLESSDLRRFGLNTFICNVSKRHSLESLFFLCILIMQFGACVLTETHCIYNAIE